MQNKIAPCLVCSLLESGTRSKKFVCPFDYLFHLQWQVKDTVRTFSQMAQQQKSSLTTTSTAAHLRSLALEAVRWSTWSLWKRSSSMTTPSSAPCFFTMDPKIQKWSSWHLFLFAWNSSKPKQAFIRLKATEWARSLNFFVINSRATVLDGSETALIKQRKKWIFVLLKTKVNV